MRTGPNATLLSAQWIRFIERYRVLRTHRFGRICVSAGAFASAIIEWGPSADPSRPGGSLRYSPALDNIPTSWYVPFVDLPASSPSGSGGARVRLLAAAVALFRAKGLNATTVDELCAKAGVTKGAFFHHFESKDDFAVEAAQYWSETTSVVFAGAAFHEHPDPLVRVLGYIELRKQLIQGNASEFSCLAGTMVQEAFDTSPIVRDACAKSIFGHADTLVDDLTAAIKGHPPVINSDPIELSRHIQAVIQGAFILAKASNDPSAAIDSIEHLRRYLLLLFAQAPSAPQASASDQGTNRVTKRSSARRPR